MDREKIKELKALLQKAEQLGAEQVKKEAREFLSAISPEDIVMAEQELINEGVEPESMRHLCPAHIELVNEQLKDLTDTLPKNHPVRTLMLEHREILRFLEALDELNTATQAIGSKAELPKEYVEKLEHIAEHLVAAEKHHQREEDVLFPELERRGVSGPPQIMRQEHVGFRAKKKELKELAERGIEDFDDFKAQLDSAADFLVFQLRDHIFKEDNILYPAALDVITDEQTWRNIKEGCDKIGYCCFTPEDVAEECHHTDDARATLDLRPMPPFERHRQIFHIWEELSPGESMKIINDHDPKPLYYQFEAEHKGEYAWEYVEQGPKDWVFVITKTK